MVILQINPQDCFYSLRGKFINLKLKDYSGLIESERYPGWLQGYAMDENNERYYFLGVKIGNPSFNRRNKHGKQI